MTADRTLHVKYLGLQPYATTWSAMQAYTDHRHESGEDQLWLLEHPPVFTQGQAGKSEHLLDPGEIPVIQTDRGGQVTYHGPGQLVAYLLLDLRRAGLGIRALVTLLEEAVIALLATYGIAAAARIDAPGVYVDEAKIASIGLRVRHGCSFHGLSLNVDMDLEPFSRINPCGFPGLTVTQLAQLSNQTDLPRVGEDLARQLASRLGYTLSFTNTDSAKEHS
ncbi:MAG: lipoyl(octanoyl) transferase LipB [Candidatus Thiodiazotropha sp. (ex Semelilucina semeliformis)]|nr:lipoyl(octanoyl) transferase LipB [Candidatus Thiodiazotropha sp. (ex Myrtea spinifera)]MCU7808911.1 lipoyl(octanoyl) transferase LipB [Candidatus Thiodiazotropha sp. (ex Semelilucina semeliformis)]